VALIVNSPSYDRVSYALSIAAMSAAQFNEVHVLFTYGAVCRLLKDKTDGVGEETAAWIREQVLRGLEKHSIQKISEMIFHLKGFGGKIYACTAAMTFHDIAEEDLIEEVDETTGIATFLETTRGATMLYI
jgi:peroxiredoxin family protein